MTNLQNERELAFIRRMDALQAQIAALTEVALVSEDCCPLCGENRMQAILWKLPEDDGTLQCATCGHVFTARPLQ